MLRFGQTATSGLGVRASRKLADSRKAWQNNSLMIKSITWLAHIKKTSPYIIPIHEYLYLRTEIFRC